MSAAPSLAPAVESGPRRNSPRHAINVSLDVITLRSGIPDSIPGRCTDISEAGIGAAVAGELILNQHVAIELKLPQVAVPLRARAIVRHHRYLHCGLQFVNLTVEQREMIRFCVERTIAPLAEVTLQQPASPKPELPATPEPITNHRPKRRIHIRKRGFVALLFLVLALAACAWWYWQRGWNQLENTKNSAIRTSPLARTRRRAGLLLRSQDRRPVPSLCIT